MINYYKMFKIINLFSTLVILVQSGQISLDNFDYQKSFNSYLILCQVNQFLRINSSSDYLNQLSIKLKLKGKNSLNLIKNGTLLNNQLNLYLLDLSENEETFEEYLEGINKFESLKVLNLSHNKISILKERQFNGLIALAVLDLSFNEIFYFEVNAFHGSSLNNLIELNLARNQLREIEDEDLNNLPNLVNIREIPDLEGGWVRLVKKLFKANFPILVLW